MSDESDPFDTHYTHGLLLVERGRYPDAHEEFRKALSINPEDPSATYFLGLCQLQMGKHKQAMATANRALELDPDDASHFILRSYCFSALNKNKEALADANQAIAIDPYNPHAHYAAAQAHTSLDQWKEAEAKLREALTIDPDDSASANLLAQCLRNLGKDDEAKAIVAGQLAKAPDDADVHAHAGWSALRDGKLKQAQEHFREALRKDPQSAIAKGGMLQAYRSKFPPYAWYLKFCFYSQKIGSQGTFIAIIGIWVAINIGKRFTTGGLKAILVILSLLFLLVVLWTHYARAMGSFFILFDRFARHTLSQNEKTEAMVVAPMLLLGIAGIPLSFAIQSSELLFACITIICMSLILTKVFVNERKLGRWVFTGLAFLCLFIGATASFVQGYEHWISYATLCALACTWLGCWDKLNSDA